MPHVYTPPQADVEITKTHTFPDPLHLARCRHFRDWDRGVFVERI